MKQALVIPQPDGKCTVVVSYSNGNVCWRQNFDTTPEAEMFLRTAGWYGAASHGYWRESEEHLPAWLAVPGKLGVCVGEVRHPELVTEEWDGSIQIRVFETTIDGHDASFHAFNYLVVPCNLGLAFDPVLAVASPPGVKLGGIGCWCNEKTAEEMGWHYLKRLELTYGEELFHQAIRAHVLRAVRGEVG